MRVAPLCIVLAIGGLLACSSPVSPIGSQSIAAPGGHGPASGTLVPFRNQPVTLSADSALVLGSGAVTLRFTVASDAAFATVVQTVDVPVVPGQRPTATLASLEAARTYYWRVAPVVGETVGSPGPTATLQIGPQVTLGAPVPVTPLTGASGLEQRPTLTVNNVSRTGPAGAVVYRFEIATSSTFSTLLASGTVSEGATRTSFVPSVELPAETTFVWRAQAFDASNEVSSAYSPTQSATTYFSVDLRTVNFQRFVNVSAWPETNRIIAVEQDGAGTGPMCINHTKRGQWPSSFFFDDPSVPIEGNQWYLARINGQWYAGSGEWLRVGQICKSGQTSELIGPDGSWGGPMDTWRPRRGDPVGYMITTPSRFYPSFRTIDERSNVVVQPWMVNGINTPEGR